MNAPVVWPGPPPGCAPNPCFDAASLLQCYCDIQATSQLISKIVQNLLATDPAFTQAIVDAIAKSGSNIPLVGVTNGSDAQPGQVGEWVQFAVPATYTAIPQTQILSLGVLQPGDWDIWANILVSTAVGWIECFLDPQPAGVSDSLFSVMGELSAGQEGVRLTSVVARASISVPTLFAMQVQTNNINGTVAGNMIVTLDARRMR